MSNPSIDTRSGEVETAEILPPAVDWRPIATSIVAGGRSDRGLVREANEDALLVTGLESVPAAAADPTWPLTLQSRPARRPPEWPRPEP